MVGEILNSEYSFNDILKEFFVQKIQKDHILEPDEVCNEWIEWFHINATVKQKIMLCIYGQFNTVEKISKILNQESLDTLKVEVSRLSKQKKIKCKSVENKIKTYIISKVGIREIYFLATNFIRECDSFSFDELRSDKSNFIDTKKVIKAVYKYLESEKIEDIRRCIFNGDRHLEISINDLSLFNHSLTNDLIDHPLEFIAIFEETLKQFQESLEYDNIIKPRFRDLPNADQININERRNKHLNKLVQLTGIIKRKSRPQPRTKKLIYLCANPGCNFSEEKIIIPQNTTKLNYLKSCPKCKSPVELIDEVEQDTQFLLLEEDMSILNHNNSNVDSIKCVLEDDLTDTEKDNINDIGKKVNIVGILRKERKPTKGGSESVDSVYYIEVNNVINDSELNDIVLTKEDIEEIKDFGSKQNSFQELKENFLPEIMGYNIIKESLLLQLFSGISINNSRAESHILLLGDPGVAKSQMTKLQATYAKKSMYSSGSGSSKAGLTGAVIKDEMTGDYVLEAGAMAKANGGQMAIDEMDKMSSDDTGVMHEALEHGEITINKANINATVNCKCSVLASANPKFGKFNPDMTIDKQIDFPPALLSRFDLIFIIRDIPNKKRDSMIANHILLPFSGIEPEQKYDKDFYKKYIHYCKEHFKPVMNSETLEYLKEQYITKRNGFDLGQSKIPLGARQLNGWIRFSFALAKANFTNEVKIEHAKRAIEIFDYCWEKLGVNNLEAIEDSNFNKDPKDGIIYQEVVRIISNNKSTKKESLEKVFSENLEKMRNVIKSLLKEGKIFEPRKGVYRLVGGNN